MVSFFIKLLILIFRGVYLILVASIIVILTCVAFLLISAYRHYGARGKTVRIRFIQDRSRNTQSSSGNGGYDTNGQGKALLDGQVTSFMMNGGGSMNLLIVYSHDSKEHENAVLAFAEFLRDAFGFEVHVSLFFCC